MQSLTSSVIVLKALGRDVDGAPAKEAGVCALCGLAISPGDLQSPLALGAGFMDDLSLAARGSQVICGYCGPLLTADGLRVSGYGAFSAAGAAPFRKWADVARQLEEPPSPPFVMAYATANNQHMAWRSPVNYSRDVFYVRVGLRDLKIRRQRLLAAVETCRVLGEAIGYYRGVNRAINAAAGAIADREFLSSLLAPIWRSRTIEEAVSRIDKTLAEIRENAALEEALEKMKEKLLAGRDPARKVLPNPFPGQLSPDLKDAGHGELDPIVWKPDFNLVFEKEVMEIMSLTAGEVWGLRFILTPGAGSSAKEDVQ